MKKLTLGLMVLMLCISMGCTKQRAKRYFDEGLAKGTNSDYTGAMQDLSKAIALSPKYADAYGYRGELKHELGDKKGALEDLSIAGELGCDFAYSAIRKIQ